MFSKINILPRWIIFTIDLFISIFSLLLAYLIKSNFDINVINFEALNRNLFILTIINSVVFFNVRTYAGIVRYTSSQDSFRILFAILISNGFLFLSNLYLIGFYKMQLIPNMVLIINGLCSFLFLITYRILVKYFFMYIKNLKIDKRKVIIYGAGETGVTTKRTLDHDSDVNMNVIAFVDDDERKTGKVVDNVKIYHSSDLMKIIRNEKVHDLVLATTNLPVDRKNKIVDLCLDHNVKVLNVPPLRNWVNGHFKATQIQNINIEDLLERQPIQIDEKSIEAQICGKRVLVTGASGSIGREIVHQIVKYKPQLIILNDVAESGLHELQLELHDLNIENNITVFIGDVRHYERMTILFEAFKPHYVYHAAAYKHVPMMENNPSEAIRTNVLGTKVIADLSVKFLVRKFVMVSTDKAVNPTNVMGASKRIAEIYVQSLYDSFVKNNVIYKNGLSHLNKIPEKPKTKFITTRFGNVLGSNGSVIPRFKSQIQKGGPITVTHSEITRYFMTIPEACKLVLEAGAMGKGGEIFIFDMGKSVKIVELAKKMIKLSGLIPERDIEIEFTGLRPGEKLYEELLNDMENTVPTHHKKIMIAKVREYCFNDVSKDIETLLELANLYQDTAVVRKMKQIVPEYKSNNSVYEELDRNLITIN
jgi:FlaA1/EpsC-like NDP-sugar epimerase